MWRGAPSRSLICQAVCRTSLAIPGMVASLTRETGPDTLMLLEVIRVPFLVTEQQ